MATKTLSGPTELGERITRSDIQPSIPSHVRYTSFHVQRKCSIIAQNSLVALSLTRNPPVPHIRCFSCMHKMCRCLALFARTSKASFSAIEHTEHLPLGYPQSLNHSEAIFSLSPECQAKTKMPRAPSCRYCRLEAHPLVLLGWP